MESPTLKGTGEACTQFKVVRKSPSSREGARKRPVLQIINIREASDAKSNVHGRGGMDDANASLPPWKRTLDVVGAIIGLALIFPLMAFVSVFIKIVSKGPVFFKQKRVGFKGKTFTIWKFRTYEVAAESHTHELHLVKLIADAQEGDTLSHRPMKKLDSHPGIIPFGNVLRKTGIDELPQLFNVLRGDMSLVGPRPAISYEVRQYSPKHRQRLQAVPGMTGLWQVSGKNRLSFNEMVDLDVSYWMKKTLLLDIMIILKTPSAIVMQLLDTIRAGQKEMALEDDVTPGAKPNTGVEAAV